MDNPTMTAQVAYGDGFFAALDQSGGSTPGALRLYGIPEDAYNSEAEMFALMHEMRVRIMRSPAFTGARVLGAILFEQTMDGRVNGAPVPAFLRERGIAAFLKVDKGLEAEADGVSLMKPMPDLDVLLVRAAALGVYGTKMRSTVNLPSPSGIGEIVRQQFQVAAQIADRGLLPIIEPEVLIKSPGKAEAEAILRTEILKRLETVPDGQQIMLKLTIPTEPDIYRDLTRHGKVARVLALSGGYPRPEACRRLSVNHGMIASFSRALMEGLQHSMSDDEFDAALGRSIEEIYQASADNAQPEPTRSHAPSPA